MKKHHSLVREKTRNFLIFLFHVHRRCCYIPVDPEMSRSQNGFDFNKIFLYKGTNISEHDKT
jgi:hypothetical protein